MVQARAASNGALIELVARYAAADSARREPQFTRLSLSRQDGRWVSRTEVAALVGQVRLASGTIRSSLFAATDEARIPDPVAAQMAEIFAADIDFHRELRKGDTFSVVYEALTADGEPVTWAVPTGRVLSAEFVNNGKAHHALWYADASGRGAYFGFDGLSKRRAFLASPMEFSRVTSGFAMRFHPILQTLRAHRGRGLRCAPRHAGALGGRRRGRVCRLAERLRQRGQGAAWQGAQHGVCAPEPHRRAQGPARSNRASASVPWAPPAGPPGRTCTSSSRSTASTSTR